MQLAQQLRSAHPDDMEYVQRGARHVHAAAVFLHADAAQAGATIRSMNFCSTRKRGFCGHYASAFADARCAPPAYRRVSSPAIRAGRSTASRTIGSCGKAMRMPGTKSGSRDAAGCASIRPRRSPRSASSAALTTSPSADEPLASRWQRSTPLARRCCGCVSTPARAVARAHLGFDQDSQRKLLECAADSRARRPETRDGAGGRHDAGAVLAHLAGAPRTRSRARRSC